MGMGRSIIVVTFPAAGFAVPDAEGYRAKQFAELDRVDL
jgi:hypothetical protein